jgi:hypothetical protein
VKNVQEKLFDFVKNEQKQMTTGIRSEKIFVKCEPEETIEIFQSFNDNLMLLKHEEVLDVNSDDWADIFEDTNSSTTDEKIPLREVRIEVEKIKLPDDFDEDHFAQLSTLGDHKMPNNKYKNIQRCGECGKWFISKKSLYSHIEK